MLSRIMHFIRTEIWRIRLKDHSRPKSFFIRQLRVLALAVRGYQEDSCKFRASALTFYSLLSISQSHKKLLALLVPNLLVKRFCLGEKPSDAAEISRNLEIPIRLVRQILFELVESNVLSEVIKEEEGKEVAYQPARDTETLTVKQVSDALDNRGNSTVPTVQSDELQRLSNCLKSFAEVVEKSPSNISLKAM